MSTNIINAFKEKVELNYLLYNSMFLTLPLDAVEQVGLLLPLLEEGCRNGLDRLLAFFSSLWMQHV